MQIKQFIALCSAFLLPLSAVAAENKLDGFYLGAGAGYSWQNVEDDLTDVNVAMTNNYHGKRSYDYNQELGFGQIFAGYGFSLGRLYLGSELSVNFYQDGESIYSSTKRKHQGLNFPKIAKENEVSPKYGFQLSMLPGFYLTPETLVYGRVGVGLSRYDSEGKTIDTHTNNSIVDNSNEDWAPEFIVGAGLRQKIWDNFSIRAEYFYTQAASFTGARDDVEGSRFGFNLPKGKIYQDNDYSLSSNNIAVSIIYNF